MMNIKKGLNASDISYGSSRVLFVEGQSGSIDEIVISRVIDFIQVKAIGPSSHIKPASKAFENVHPAYFFVVDRDHQEDDEVDKTWKDFEAGYSNLIIWRKKELENYFLDPTLLHASTFLKKDVTINEIKASILNYAKSNIYMHIVNRVIIELRETLKNKWIDTYKCENLFPDANSALSVLLGNRFIQEKPTNVSSALSASAIESLFYKNLELMLGANQTELSWEQGKWLELMPGKNILRQILNDTRLFNVEDTTGQCVTGLKKQEIILSRLLKDKSNWPEDFKKLNELLKNRA